MLIVDDRGAALKVGEGQRVAGAATTEGELEHEEAHRGFFARVNSRLQCACVAVGRRVSSRTLDDCILFV
ncbi:unnamed protein product [Leptosia nina]|uniref:Uncharacterized protein n=1 Tax=Leptosia nina TaxID=320188 RepID=A0AAV1JPQ6_9NEOP